LASCAASRSQPPLDKGTTVVPLSSMGLPVRTASARSGRRWARRAASRLVPLLGKGAGSSTNLVLDLDFRSPPWGRDGRLGVLILASAKVYPVYLWIKVPNWYLYLSWVVVQPLASRAASGHRWASCAALRSVPCLDKGAGSSRPGLLDPAPYPRAEPNARPPLDKGAGSSDNLSLDFRSPPWGRDGRLCGQCRVKVIPDHLIYGLRRGGETGGSASSHPPLVLRRQGVAAVGE
jgi:hypothetical protein